MLGSIIGTIIGAGVIHGCCRLVDKDGSNVGAWIVLVAAVWATTQSALELGRALLGACSGRDQGGGHYEIIQ